MKLRVFRVYNAAKESFWFLPAVMALLAGSAAIGSVALDRTLGEGWVQGMALVWSGGAEGARSVLSVIAGSTMTVVSIVFSITITALAQTSSHFGPRVLRNFTRDRRNQFVLGVFVAAFLYSLLVLRTVRSDGEPFVPYVSVNLGIALALTTLGVLIFFIHHIATSIQADLLIARIGDECRSTVAALFPEADHAGTSRGPAYPEPADVPEEPDLGDPLPSPVVGHVQSVDEERLLGEAHRAGVVVTVLAQAGDFVASGQPLARVAPRGRLDGSLHDALQGAFSVGSRRTPEQDLAYSIQQLVEIAARALSPGVNEPFTAMLCIDQVGAALRSLAGRGTRRPVRTDEAGTVRVVTRPLTFPDLVQMSLGMIRRYANGEADVYLALLRALRHLGPSLRRVPDRDALQFEARQIAHDARAVRNPRDRERVLEQAKEVRELLRSVVLDRAARAARAGDGS